jgi:hypothetical protein
VLVILGVVAVVLVGVLVYSRRSRADAAWRTANSCRHFQPGADSASYPDVVSYDKDPFDFSVVEYSTVGFFYSYKHRHTNETKGPKILVALDIMGMFCCNNSVVGYSPKLNPYSFGVSVLSRIGTAYSFEFTIGKNASDGSIVWAGLDDKEDGNVTISPNVVHMRFDKNAPYKVYNDTVFLVWYVLTNDTLQVQQRDIDLSNVTSSECGIEPLLKDNVELSIFYHQWYGV